MSYGNQFVMLDSFFKRIDLGQKWPIKLVVVMADKLRAIKPMLNMPRSISEAPHP